MTFTLADQAQALALAARLAVLHPSLPAAGLGVSHHADAPALDLCFLDAPAAVEAWREALHVPLAEMTCTQRDDGRLTVQFEATVDGVLVRAFTILSNKQPEGVAA
ncbi:hypothetical protein ACFW2X_06525 [Streptomyces antibioticus]|uniref:hypothetical protein n=1 Tax=Streptomyces antibioticus TaxID=1890 RepID=UPI0036958F9E